MKSEKVLDVQISSLSMKGTVELIESWIEKNVSKYVCICNTHSLVTSSEDKTFKHALNNAGLRTADGMPLVWIKKIQGFRNQERVDGPNLMKELCQVSSLKGYKIGLYGSTNEKLEKLEKKLTSEFPGINIVIKLSPPFRPIDEHEDLQDINLINQSDADIVFVSLGCPKQELWMSRNSSSIHAICLGVGAAFDFINGDFKRPHIIFQKLGLEWFFRLMNDPKRLFKRYLYNNNVFVYKYLKSRLVK